jgi:chromosome partitioning protein
MLACCRSTNLEPEEDVSGGKPVIVIGNEKGGSGKTTVAIHLVAGLAAAGLRPGAIDLDHRQRSFSHFFANRAAWGERAKRDYALPKLLTMVPAPDGEAVPRLAAAIGELSAEADVIVVDCPGADTALGRAAHANALIIVTPLNDSFVDFDVLGTVDPTNFALTGVGHYAEMVREARRQRRLVDGGLTDWVVVRNRLSTLGSRNKRLVGEGVDELGRQLGFRAIDGFAERVVYREFFPRGLTALDDINEDTLGQRPNPSHLTARDEVRNLIDALKLPIDERGKRRAAARAEWIVAANKPLDTHGLLAD